MAGYRSSPGGGYGRLKLTYPIVHEKHSGMYKCTLCSYQSLHRSSVRSHYAVHSNARPYACDMCEYEAKRLTDLKKHQVLRHGRNLTSLRLQGRRPFGALSRTTLITKATLDMQDQASSAAPPAHVGSTHSGENNCQIDAMLDLGSSGHSSTNCAEGCQELAGRTDGMPSALYPDNHSGHLKLNDLPTLSVNNVNVKSEPRDTNESEANHTNDDDKPAAVPVEFAAQLPPGQPEFSAALPPDLTPWSAKALRQSTAVEPRRHWHCEHCNITYYDSAMYVLHAGLHNSADPWKCNLCGRAFHDVYGFTSHFVNGHVAHRD